MPVYSMDIREKIVSAYEAGNTSIRKVAKRFMVSNGVVTRLLRPEKDDRESHAQTSDRRKAQSTG